MSIGNFWMGASFAGLLVMAVLSLLSVAKAVADTHPAAVPQRSNEHQHRMGLLSKWTESGVVDMGLEFDGGVFLEVSLVGGPEVMLREQNSLAEAIDHAELLMQLAAKEGP